MSVFLGRLNWGDLAFAPLFVRPTLSDAIAASAASIALLGALATLLLVWRYRLWTPLWRDWLTSLDHKRIGVMYIVIALVMMVRAIAEAVLMRFQHAAGLDGGFLTTDHFAQLFSTHGTIMIFFVAMPFLTGLINIVTPLQIGARDVSFPLLNALSLALTAAGAALVMTSLVIGDFSTGGWTGYPPYTGIDFNPGVGVDYWIWSLTLASIGSTMSGINFAVTVYKERAPGMTFMRLPMFTWTALCASILMIFALPPLTVATTLLAADRYLGFHFFTAELGGNMMNFANLFWLFGHPEVYILILPAFGVFSEVFATFSAKRLYGYASLVIATMSIAVLSFTVWVHHFFTMGQSAMLNVVFGIATMTIGVPTGVKLFDWMATMYRGRVRFSVPMIYALSFTMLFVIGGLTGIILANPPVDYQVHNTLFLVAHFHNMLVPGLLFGMLAGYTYWFPKVFGFRLDNRWGYISAVCWPLGFVLVFFPLYWVGLLGMTRRTASYTDAAYEPWMFVSAIGAITISIALTSLLIQLFVSIRNRRDLATPLGDPWDGRTLEWSLPAPAPDWNFARLPEVCVRDAFWEAKRRGVKDLGVGEYQDIKLPRNSPLGVVFTMFGFFLGFGLVWHIWWLALVSLLVLAGVMIGRSFMPMHDRVVAASELRDYDQSMAALAALTTPVGRDKEGHADNRGSASWEGT